MTRVLRDAGLSALLDGNLEVLADGLEFTEGPLWLPDGALLFQDIKAEKTYRVEPDGRLGLVRDKTGAANGQDFAADGRIIFCEQNGRRVSRMDRDGSNVETVVEHFQGKRLNSPNDLVCRADGLVYFTDPPYGVSAADKELDFQGVYLLDRTGDLTLLIDDFEKPNGLAFSPDERMLYINDTGRYEIRSFYVEHSGRLRDGSGRVLAKPDPAETGGPDGLKVDRDGRLYAAVAEGVWVYEPDGRLLGIIATPKRPANLAWCGPDGKTLALTAKETVYRIRLKVAGQLPRHLPARP